MKRPVPTEALGLNSGNLFLFFKRAGLISFVLLLQACGLVTKESIYEGVRSQEKLKNTGQLIEPNAMPSYQDYENERNRLKKGDESTSMWIDGVFAAGGYLSILFNRLEYQPI
jgi:hypothetical protein